MSTAPAPTHEEAPAENKPPTVVLRCDGTRAAKGEVVAIAPLDFRNPSFLAESELRRLRSVHEDYLRGLTARLSTLLRSEVALNLTKFGTQSYEEFIGGLKSPGQISMFRVSPLNGVGYIEMPPAFAVALTNRILGGREPVANPEAYLTDIETALLEDVIAIFYSEWCELWREQAALTAQLLGHETNPRFMQSTEKNAAMLVAAIDVAFGRAQGIVQVAVPLSMIEPMMKQMDAGRARETGAHRGGAGVAWKAHYDNIAIPLCAELIAPRTTVADLLKLKPGDVIELPSTALDSTRLNVAGAIRFTARAGQQNGYMAVQITEKLSDLKK